MALPKYIAKVDFFVWSCESKPKFIINSVPHDNKTVFTRLKKNKANHLLKYFFITFDERGKEVVLCEIPDAFMGLILNQIKDALNGDVT